MQAQEIAERSIEISADKYDQMLAKRERDMLLTRKPMSDEDRAAFEAHCLILANEI